MTETVRRGVRATCGWVLTACALLIALPAQAAEYAVRFDPRIEAGGLYDDNYRLTPGSDGNVEVSGILLDAQVTARFRSQTSELEFTPRVRTRYFPSDGEEDDTSEFVVLDYRSEGPTTRLGARAQCARQDVTSSERPQADVDDPALGTAPGVDTGFVSTRSTQTLCQIEPRFAFDVSQRSRIELSARYVDADYSRDGAGTPTGFGSLGAAAELANDLNLTNTLRTRLIASRFDPDRPDSPRSDTYGAQLEWQQRASATLESYLRVGIERVATDDAPGARDEDLRSSDYVLGAGLRRDYQITQWFIDLSRSVAPSSSGVLVTRNQVKVRVKRDLTPMLAGFVRVLGIDDAAAEDDLGFRDRQYAVGTVGLQWRLSRRFTLLGEYGYTWQEYEDDGAAARSNRMSLSVVYEPNRLLP